MNMNDPIEVDGCSIWADTDNVSRTHTGVWVSLYPNNPLDRRVWEFDRVTGRVVVIRGPVREVNHMKTTTKTRFPELSYTHFAGDWRIVDTDGGAYIGPYYRSRAELLADLERYAAEFGVA